MTRLTGPGWLHPPHRIPLEVWAMLYFYHGSVRQVAKAVGCRWETAHRYLRQAPRLTVSQQPAGIDAVFSGVHARADKRNSRTHPCPREE